MSPDLNFSPKRQYIRRELRITEYRVQKYLSLRESFVRCVSASCKSVSALSRMVNYKHIRPGETPPVQKTPRKVSLRTCSSVTEPDSTIEKVIGRDDESRVIVRSKNFTPNDPRTNTRQASILLEKEVEHTSFVRLDSRS